VPLLPTAPHRAFEEATAWHGPGSIDRITGNVQNGCLRMCTADGFTTHPTEQWMKQLAPNAIMDGPGAVWSQPLPLSP
jgi:hypothetical protein